MCCRSLTYAACNAHAPYRYLWPAPLYNTFPHFLINEMISEKKNVTEPKIRVLTFSTALSEIFRRRNEQDMIKKKYIGLYVKFPLFASDFNET